MENWLDKFIDGDTLKVHDDKITTLDVSQYHWVKKLDCSGCKALTEIVGLEKLTALKELIVAFTAVATLDVSHQSGLKSLTCALCKDLTEIVGLENLTALEELIVLRIAMTTMDVRHQLGLKKLFCDCPETLTEIVGLEKLTELEELHVGSAAIATLDVSHQPGLKWLGCSGCRALTEIAGLEKLTALEALYVDFTAIATLDVRHQPGLKKLGCSGCEALTEVVGLEKLTALEELNVGVTAIATLDVRHQPGLKKLGCSGCRALTEIAGLENLTALEELSVGGTAIVTLDVSHQPGLKRLGCSGCRALTEIAGLEKLTVLEILRLSGTSFRRVPESIRGLKNLEKLDLSGLHLETLPDWLPELELRFTREEHGDGICLYATTVDGVDMSIFDQPQEYILDWFKNRNKALNEIKVVFLGDGDVGKSWTIARLMLDGNMPEEEEVPEKSTPGILIKDKDYRLEDGRDILVHFWDFGGQDVLYSMHRMFLTKNTFYVVMVSVHNGRQEERAMAWLTELKSFAKNLPVILVLNQKDLNPNAKVNEVDLKRQFPNLLDIVEMIATEDSRDYFNENFTARLLRYISMRKELSYEVSASEIRVLRRLQQMDTPYIQGNTFKRYCREEGVAENEVIRKTLLARFGELGACFCYGESAWLQSFMILRPDWLTNAIYGIYFNKFDDGQNGLIPRESIYRMLGKQQTVGENRKRRVMPDMTYEVYEVEYILKVIRQFRLSYAIDEYEFIPALCEKNTPNAAVQYEEDEGTLEFRMEYINLPENVVHRLMVDLRAHLDLDVVWYTGAKFKLKGTGLSAVVKAEGNTLRIFVRSENAINRPNTYFSYVKSAVEYITEEIGLEVPERYVVYKRGDKKVPFNYDDMIWMYEHSLDAKVPSRELDDYIPVGEILKQTDYLVKQKEMELVRRVCAACTTMQGEPKYLKGKDNEVDEDERNRFVKYQLDHAYVVLDQHQQGQSATRIKIGNHDLAIYQQEDRSVLWTIYEGLIIHSASNSQIDYWEVKHLKKLLDNYNSAGCPFLILTSYVDCGKDQFKQIVGDYKEHMTWNAPASYEGRGNPVEIDLGTKEQEANHYVRCFERRYARGGNITRVYHFFVHMDTAPALVAP